jgi:hypothetical protein
MRSGTRCTTLTQLPLAFCAGRIENCEPVPGLTATTVPQKVRSGNVSTITWARWPIFRLVMSVSFGLASTQGAASSTTVNTGVLAMTKRPSWMLSTCVAVPSIGARSMVWSRSRLA